MNDLTHEQRRELEARAKAATEQSGSARWHCTKEREDGTSQVYSPSRGAMRVVVPVAETSAVCGAFIAAASPDVVLALLAERERLAAALRDALEGLEEMIGYVPKVYRAKWEHDGYIARARAALDEEPIEIGPDSLVWAYFDDDDWNGSTASAVISRSKGKPVVLVPPRGLDPKRVEALKIVVERVASSVVVRALAEEPKP